MECYLTAEFAAYLAKSGAALSNADRAAFLSPDKQLVKLQWNLLRDPQERKRITADIYRRISEDAYQRLQGAEMAWICGPWVDNDPRSIYLKISYDGLPLIARSLQAQTEFLGAVWDAIAVPLVIFEGKAECGAEICIRCQCSGGNVWMCEFAENGG